MKYSTLSLDFENMNVEDTTQWKQIWNECMGPDDFAEYVYMVIENSARRFQFTHDFEPDVYMYSLGKPYEIKLKKDKNSYVLTLNLSDRSTLVVAD